MKYHLIGPDGLKIESFTKGEFGGHSRLKIYGRLDCPSAVKWVEKGNYKKHRVFFKDEQSALSAGYRPCSVCMKATYSLWKLRRGGVTPTTTIKNLWECGHKTEIALIQIGNEIQSPKWSSLRKYWKYASPDDVEYLTISECIPYVLFCMTTARGQGGIISLWDIANKRWAQISNGSYAACAFLYLPLNVIISLHYISHWGVPARQAIFLTPLDYSKDISEDKSIELTIKPVAEGFIPGEHNISQFSQGSFQKNEFGPLGIYYDCENKEFYAHDCGNIFKFSSQMISDALK